uniref:Uncharacterized protein n=1 Tax=Timema monikensis TaxID=170555 RepID=A0A7R9E489_9NEOP|nr:unnamed protein product [Timema monikensis]
MPTTKFEGQLAPACDPNMKVEWFFNGKPLPHKGYQLVRHGRDPGCHQDGCQTWHHLRLAAPQGHEEYRAVQADIRHASMTTGEAIAETVLTVKSREDDYRNGLKNSQRPWYDYGLTQYLGNARRLSWRKYSTARAQEETRLRESTHQFAIPGEKIVASSVAKVMAQSYEQKLDANEQQPLTGSPQVSRRSTEFVINSQTIQSLPPKDSQTIQSLPPEPSKSSIHGREVHVAK